MAERGYYKTQASEVIDDIFDIMSETLAGGEEIILRGFGTFKVKVHKGHCVEDIHTRKQRVMDDYRMVIFRPGDILKDAVKTGEYKNNRS